jgi:hypothetical protein
MCAYFPCAAQVNLATHILAPVLLGCVNVGLCLVLRMQLSEHYSDNEYLCVHGVILTNSSGAAPAVRCKGVRAFAMDLIYV